MRYTLQRLYFFISCSQGIKSPRGFQRTLIFITTWNLSGLNGSTQLLWAWLQLYISLGKTEERVVSGEWNVQNAQTVLLFRWSTVVPKTYSKGLVVFNGKYHEYVIKVVAGLSCELQLPFFFFFHNHKVCAKEICIFRSTCENSKSLLSLQDKCSFRAGLCLLLTACVCLWMMLCYRDFEKDGVVPMWIAEGKENYQVLHIS